MAPNPRVLSSCRQDGPLHLGRWRIVGQLGRGSGTVVHLVTDGWGQQAALKTCEPDSTTWARGVLARRLHHEATALRLVGGRGVVRLREDGSEAGWPHLVLELLDGPTLAELVTRFGGLRVDRVARLGALLCKTVSGLHASGVTHGDLKPTNIVCPDGGPVLIDLDAATLGSVRPRNFLTPVGAPGSCPNVGGLLLRAVPASDSDGGDTMDMRVRATPAWIAPEVATGAAAGPAADVFGLGAVLANASSGRAPFGRGSAATVLQRVRTRGPDLRGVAPGLKPLLMAALERRPECRPSAAEFEVTLSTGGFDR